MFRSPGVGARSIRVKLVSTFQRKLVNRVYGRIRAALTDGEFSPGERLRTKDLSVQLGTSVTLVREAIFKLVSERALEMRAATAIHVPTRDPDDLRQIQLMRMALEGAAAERACVMMTTEDVYRLSKMARRRVVGSPTHRR